MKPEPPKLSRRRSIIAAGGVVMGAGLGTLVSEPAAQADDDSKLTLKIYKRTEKGRTLVGTIDVPPEVADTLEGTRDDVPLRFRLESDDEKGTVHGEAHIAEGVKVKTAIRRAKARRKTAPRK